MSKLTATLERYRKAIEKLEQSKSVLSAEEVLAVLNIRDALQIALKKEEQLPTSRLNQIIQLDEILRQKAAEIVRAIGVEQLAQWRESVHPAPEAWWWNLETVVPLHHRNRWDSLWKIFTLASWTANISFLASLGTKFFSGGVGIIGGTVVTLPSLIALIHASSTLTKTGREGFDNLLTKFGVAPHQRKKIKFVSTLAVSGFIVAIWLSLPAFSNFYNRRGLKNNDVGKLGSAEQDWQKATSLNPDNADAYYNLGNLYEDLQQFDKAKKNYQIALGGNIPEAFNNLGRLYIKEKKYSQALALLSKGLLFANEKNSNLEVKYSFFKNLGWARLKQGRNKEAKQHLQAAIGIAQRKEVAQYISNPGSAHCLLAQVLDKQEQKAVMPTASSPHAEWQKCCQLGSRLNEDEDEWLYMAQKKLQKAGKECKVIEN